jgi:hypothetical protein
LLRRTKPLNRNRISRKFGSRSCRLRRPPTGGSTRFAYKILSETFNFDNSEVAADPVHLLYVIEQAVRRETSEGGQA